MLGHKNMAFDISEKNRVIIETESVCEHHVKNIKEYRIFYLRLFQKASLETEIQNICQRLFRCWIFSWFGEAQ